MFGYMLKETSADDSWIKNVSSLQSIFTTPGGVANGGSNANEQQSGGGNTSNYNREGTSYIHTGRPGRPRKADTSSDSREYDATNG